MAEWRIGRGWSEEEITERIDRLRELPVNFQADYSEMRPETGWNTYHSEALIAREPPGPPLAEGPFRRAEVAVANYHFSDPDIVIGHFDADSRLLGRRMLLEMRAVRVLRYAAGVVVGSVLFEEQDGCSTFGFRYDTLQGHIEMGSEWFLLRKRQDTGEITFRIEAAWLPGQFPNWWSRLGFRLLGPRYQRRWHHEAHWRLFRIAHGGMPASPFVDDLGIAHAGPDVVYERIPRQRTIREHRWREKETIQSS
jgi:uncharacterized protein (UPF0548 family)